MVWYKKRSLYVSPIYSGMRDHLNFASIEVIHPQMLTICFGGDTVGSTWSRRRFHQISPGNRGQGGVGHYRGVTYNPLYTPGSAPAKQIHHESSEDTGGSKRLRCADSGTSCTAGMGEIRPDC